jgi:hypothetical protein
MVGGGDEVAFVFTGLVVDDDDDPAFDQGLQRFIDPGEIIGHGKESKSTA